MNETGNPLDQYVTELLGSKQISDTMENHAELMNEVNEYIDSALLEALPDASLDQLSRAADDNTISDNMIEDLLKSNGADPDEIIKKALADFKEGYMKGDR